MPSTPNQPRSAGASGRSRGAAGSQAISAVGRISRTCWKAQRLKGGVRQLASVTWRSGAGGNPDIMAGVVTRGLGSWNGMVAGRGP